MEQLIQSFKVRTAGIVDRFKKEISSVRTNRPSASFVEDIKVTYYDQTMPLNQVGSVGITPPREIHIQVWDKAATAAVVKAIESSSLGLTPSVEGNVVRLFLPELSEERREEFVRHVKKISEQHRIELRHARDEANKEIKKKEEDGELTEDEKFKVKEEVQKVVDETNKAIETALEGKIYEIKE